MRAGSSGSSGSPPVIELGDIERHFAGLIREIDAGHGIDDELWTAAALTCHRNREGHVCLDIGAEGGSELFFSGRFARRASEGAHDGAPEGAEGGAEGETRTLPRPGRWIEALGKSRAVMDPDDREIRPLVLERFEGEHGPSARLYLHRMWEAQKKIALGIEGLLDGGEKGEQGEKGISLDAAVKEGIDEIFGGDPTPVEPTLDPTPGDEYQRKAAQVALRHRFCVITGGPGTGKTTTVANIIALLVEYGLAQPERIRLAAPTGKAASRLSAAVIERCARLQPKIPALASLDSATTLHKLLLQSRGYLPLQALIIDECSMVDISLMARTLSSLPPDARLILLGDADQLASVQPGSVFADLCPNAALGSALSPCVVRLEHNWRFPPDTGIGRLANAIVEGDAEGAISCLRKPDEAKESRVDRQALEDPSAFDRLADECTTKHFLPMVQEVSEVDFPVSGERPDKEVIERIRERFNSFRVLCAHRRGAFGSERFNKRVEEFLREKNLAPYGEEFYLGRPIIVDRNDPHTGLANGDTGIVVRNAKGEKRVWFPDAGGEGDALRSVSPQRLPEHRSFFALTVHRSQGSEYDEVAIVLGPADSPLATRQLLYTAVTRAKRRAVLYAQEEAIVAAVGRETGRSSGLPDALRRIDPT